MSAHADPVGTLACLDNWLFRHFCHCWILPRSQCWIVKCLAATVLSVLWFHQQTDTGEKFQFFIYLLWMWLNAPVIVKILWKKNPRYIQIFLKAKVGEVRRNLRQVDKKLTPSQYWGSGNRTTVILGNMFQQRSGQWDNGIFPIFFLFFFFIWCIENISKKRLR